MSLFRYAVRVTDIAAISVPSVAKAIMQLFMENVSLYVNGFIVIISRSTVNINNNNV